MNETTYIYDIRIPAPGLPENQFTVVTADSVQAACEVARILLECRDDRMDNVQIVRRAKL